MGPLGVCCALVGPLYAVGWGPVYWANLFGAYLIHRPDTERLQQR